MPKLLHASDLHLGRPLRAFPMRPGLDLDCFRHCASRTLTRLIDLAIAERVELLVLAGDLIEQSVRNYKIGLRLVHELSRLEDSGGHVVWVRGNHDAENRVIANLMLPSHVHEIGLSGAQTLILEALELCVVGASYTRRACFEDLLAQYPSKSGSFCHVGVLHTSADGAISGDHYAPCRRSDLIRKGYDYFALGHVHRPLVLSRSVPIAYSGCLQGRSFLEGGPRGCVSLRLEDERVAEPRHRSLEVVRFGTISVDASQLHTLDRLLAAVASRAAQASLSHPECALVARIRIIGRRGIEALLSLAPTIRDRALQALVEKLPERLAVDGFWLDLRHAEMPVTCIYDASRCRIDVY